MHSEVLFNHGESSEWGRMWERFVPNNFIGSAGLHLAYILAETSKIVDNMAWMTDYGPSL